jgi:peptidoglycan/LPS O-acetylase OafA/YrhL
VTKDNPQIVNYKQISYFNGLNALRFFAALLVVMHHAETIKRKNEMANLEWLSLFRNGGNAVTFFFVLSGFLITYLLLKEAFNTKKVNVKHFYFKRILRIWPLYFLVFIIGTLILPELFKFLNINYEFPYTFGKVWFYFVFFFPGLVTFFFGHHLLEPLWSIGVEEIFYLIWAPIFKFFKKKILFVLVTVIALKIILIIIDMNFNHNELFSWLVNTLKFEDMAVGGLGAYFIFNRKFPLSKLLIYKLPIQIFVYLFLSIYMIFNVNITSSAWVSFFSLPVIPSLLLDLSFVYLIIGVSLVDKNLIKLKSKWLSFLGEISYGIYMYHMLVIFTIVLLMKKILLGLTPFMASVLFYILIFCGIIAVSAISKVFFENKFLAIKEKRFEKKN